MAKIFNISLILLLIGCAFDGGQSKKIIGDYYLHKWEDHKKYYIIEGDEKLKGGGVIEGTVQKIGWSETHIFAKRKSTFEGDPDGWMVIDVNNKKLSGPLTDAEFMKEQDRLLEKGLTVYTPSEAWDILE